MKIFNKLSLIAAAAMMLFGAAACTQKEDGLSRAVMVSSKSLTFEVKDAPEVTLSVYADADWTVEAPEWVTVSPMAGTGCMDITVSVSDNLRDGTPDNPRKGHIYVTGSNLDIRGDVYVYQEGDKYRDVKPVSLADIAGMKDEDVVIIESAVVAATTTKGFVLSNGTDNIYTVAKVDGLTVGSEISVKAEKGVESGLPAIVNVDDVQVIGTQSPVYPAEVDITELLSSYNPSTREFVSVTGMLNGSKVEVDGAEFAVNCSDVDPSFNLSDIDGHKVTVKGFFAGLKKPVINVHVAAVEDLGGAGATIYFNDDFSWLEEMAKEAGAGDTVGESNKKATAPNIWSKPELKEVFEPEFTKRGYTDLNPDEELLYLQPGYLKLSKTGGHNTALQLQVAELPADPTDVTVSFKFAMMVQDSGVVDAGPVGVYIVKGPGSFEGTGNVSEGFNSVQEKDTFCWNEASVVAKGVTNQTKFVFMNLRVLKDDGSFNWAVSGAGRIFLDDIKIVGGSDAAASGKVVFSDDFEWMADDAEALEAEEAVEADNPSSNAVNLIAEASKGKENALHIVNGLKERGYTYLWGPKCKDATTAAKFTSNADEIADPKVLYVCTNYLKFGKSDVSAAISFTLNKLDATSNVKIEFDWCWQVTGSNNPDIMTLQIDATSGKFAATNSETSEELESAQSTEGGNSHLAWQHATVILNAAEAGTVLTVRPKNANPYVSNTRGQNRWYIDNIRVTTVE